MDVTPYYAKTSHEEDATILLKGGMSGENCSNRDNSGFIYTASVSLIQHNEY